MLTKFSTYCPAGLLSRTPQTFPFSCTFKSFSLGDSDHINDLIAVEHLLDVDWLLKVLLSPLHLVFHSASVHLDLHDVGTLLVKTLNHAKLWGREEGMEINHHYSIRLFYCHKVPRIIINFDNVTGTLLDYAEINSKDVAHLSMADDSDDLAILLHLVEVLINAGLSTIVLPALGSLGECLLLRAIPSMKWGVREREEGEKKCLKLISTHGMSGVSELPQIAKSKTELTTFLHVHTRVHAYMYLHIHASSIMHICTHIPVLVEPPPALLTQMLGKDGLERTQTSWRLDVADHTHHHQGRSLDDRHGLHHFLLVTLCREQN